MISLAIALLIPVAAIHSTEPIAVFTPGARILFQGDSITDGNRGNERAGGPGANACRHRSRVACRQSARGKPAYPMRSGVLSRKVTLRLYQNLLNDSRLRPPSAALWKSITLQ